MNQLGSEALHSLLSKQDLTRTLGFLGQCLDCRCEAEFHRLILSFASFLGFEFVLYCYTRSAYEKGYSIRMENISNPVEWMAEYDREGFLQNDPVRREMERRLAVDNRLSCIYWDAYDWELSPREHKVVERRIHFGLNYGCSAYCDSDSKDFTFLISFASRTTAVDQRVAAIATLIISHLMVTRKRLDMLGLVQTFTQKEEEVARWVMDGKTNREIAKILGVTANTVKFHLKNIFCKLEVANRQQAVAVLLAERYLSI